MKNLFFIILGLSLIGLGVYGVIHFFIILFSSYVKIIATFFAFLAAIMGTLITQYYIKKREQENAHREKKIEIYNSFIEITSRAIAGGHKDTSIKKPTDKELADFMFKFKSEILLWGSPGVIKEMLNFQNASQRGLEPLITANNLYKEFRKDIGLSNFGLNNCELIKIGLTDPEELDNNEMSKKCI